MPRTKNDSTITPRIQPFKRAVTQFGLAYSSARDAHFRGELAIVRVGRSWYVELAELSRFLERHTERGGSEDGAA